MSDYSDLHDDVKQILAGQSVQGERLARIETILIPNPGQPGRLDELEDRLSSLERAKSYALGAWGVFSGLVGWHVFGGHHK